MHDFLGNNEHLTVYKSSFLHFQTPIGMISLHGDKMRITRIVIDGIVTGEDQSPAVTPLLVRAKTQLQEYFDGKRQSFELPIDRDQLKGFQQEVLEVASSIPFGEIRTYGQIAALLNKPKASRAVGTALARNPLPILIPCHRVLAADGHLTGYLGAKGVGSKKWLLELEGHTIVGEKLG
jgi:methylated-DNA-[protein]-cysteine S-methyltransferase